jgi:hypothetical protein
MTDRCEHYSTNERIRAWGECYCSMSAEAEALRAPAFQPATAAESKHYDAALRAYEANDQEAASWHLGQKRRLEIKRWLAGQMPTAALGAPAAEPDPEASDYLLEMLNGERLGLLRWNPKKRDWEAVR